MLLLMVSVHDSYIGLPKIWPCAACMLRKMVFLLFFLVLLCWK